MYIIKVSAGPVYFMSQSSSAQFLQVLQQLTRI